MICEVTVDARDFPLSTTPGRAPLPSSSDGPGQSVLSVGYPQRCAGYCLTTGSLSTLLTWIFISMFFAWCTSKFGLHRWCSGKESACQCRMGKKHRFDLWVGEILWNRKWQPTKAFVKTALLFSGVMKLWCQVIVFEAISFITCATHHVTAIDLTYSEVSSPLLTSSLSLCKI